MLIGRWTANKNPGNIYALHLFCPSLLSELLSLFYLSRFDLLGHLTVCSPVWFPVFLKVHKIENFFDSDFGICVISLLVMHK
jgi:hypothetical protein